MQSRKGFTLAELMVVVLVIGVLLAILVPRFYRQATNTVDGARIVANFQYIAQAIGNYASDNGKYPEQLFHLNFLPNGQRRSYQYLPEVSINGNALTLDGLVYTYAPSDSDCNGGPSLFVSRVPTEAYNEVKSYIGSALKWRFDDASQTVKLCL
jgi:prepilin-type N-terminal cleavage/methylation domain-containing protein